MLIRNTAAQFIGRASAVIAGFVGLPLYLSYLGAENFGLIGVFLSLQAFMGFLDFGLPLSSNRQISIYRSDDAPILTIMRFIRGFEIAYFGLTLIGFVGLYCLAGLIAEYWLVLETVSKDSAALALQVAALAAVLRFPCNFYSNILFAYERHVSANLYIALATISRVVVAILFLELFDQTPLSFFYSQVVVNAAELLILASLFWKDHLSNLFVSPLWSEVRKTMGLSLSLSAISISSLLQTQLDKVILSKVLSLSDFGLYSAAYALAMGIAPLSYAVGNAIFPTISRLVRQNKIRELHDILQKSSGLILVLIGPAATFFVTQGAYIEPLLHLFTPDAGDVIPLLSIMTIGVCFHAFTVLPHAFRVACDQTLPIIAINLSHLIPYGIGLFYAINSFGLLGAAVCFVILNGSITLWHWISLSYPLKQAQSWVFNASLSLGACFVLFVLGLGLSHVIPTQISSEIGLLLSICGVGLFGGSGLYLWYKWQTSFTLKDIK